MNSTKIMSYIKMPCKLRREHKDLSWTGLKEPNNEENILFVSEKIEKFILNNPIPSSHKKKYINSEEEINSVQNGTKKIIYLKNSYQERFKKIPTLDVYFRTSEGKCIVVGGILEDECTFWSDESPPLIK